jgi:hypothetical protein
MALALWLFRNLILTRLRASVQHEFNGRLEEIKTDLRLKEGEIAALRGGALTALASRHVELEKRRLLAADQLWSTVIALGPAKGIAPFIAVVKFETAAERSKRDPKFRQIFEHIGSGVEIGQLDLSGAAKARPFLTPVVWGAYTAYLTAILHGVMRLQVLKTGAGGDVMVKETAILELLKTALPYHVEYINQHGTVAIPYLIEELEANLLRNVQAMLSGVEADKAAVEQSAEIVKRSAEIRAASDKPTIPD